MRAIKSIAHTNQYTYLRISLDSVMVDSLKLSGRGVVQRAPSPGGLNGLLWLRGGEGIPCWKSSADGK